jgi:hypothetical protein
MIHVSSAIVSVMMSQKKPPTKKNDRTLHQMRREHHPQRFKPYQHKSLGMFPLQEDKPKAALRTRKGKMEGIETRLYRPGQFNRSFQSVLRCLNERRIMFFCRLHARMAKKN